MKDQNLNYFYLPALKARQSIPGKAVLPGKNMLQNWNISWMYIG